MRKLILDCRYGKLLSKRTSAYRHHALPPPQADAGFLHLTSTDISEVCIDAMRAKHAHSHAHIKWEVADMLQLEQVFAPDSFDVVLDKAGLDALLAHKGDVWEAPEALLAQTHTVCQQVQTVLRVGGRFLSLSFGQPHFRLQYLGVGAGAEGDGGSRPVWASIAHEPVDVGFGYFWYVLTV